MAPSSPPPGSDDPISRSNGHAQHDGTGASSSGMSRGLSSSGLNPRTSPTVSQKPLFGAGETNGVSFRQGSVHSTTRTDGGARTEQHLRRRSSFAGMHSALDLGGGEDGPRQPASSGMERVSSLTTFMNSGGQAKVLPKEAEKERVRQAAAGVGAKSPRGGGRGRIQRRRLYSSLIRLLGLVTGVLLVIYVLRNVAVSLSGRSKAASPDAGDGEGPAWLSKLPGQKLLFDSLETVPMPTRTHPRTPRRGEQYKLSLADYLKTRLGSHFAFPSANTPSRSTKGSQLWLTSATSQSIGVSTPHLVTFFRRLQSASSGTPNPQDDLLSPYFSSSRLTNVSLPLENSDQRHADRALVVLCRDEGCMDYCRRDKELY